MGSTTRSQRSTLTNLLNDIEEVEWLFPFDYMSRGESFFIPTVRPSTMLYTIDVAAKRAGVRVKSHTTMHEGCLGVRVWRLE